jgi:hypothetical protein
MDSKTLESDALIELDDFSLSQVAGGESLSLNFTKIEYKYSPQSAQ